MFSPIRGYVWAPDDATPDVRNRLKFLNVVGYKACGLALLPKKWTPPFLVVSAELYGNWFAASRDQREKLLHAAVKDVEFCLSGWIESWPHGLALRSSATSETLRDRGAYQSIQLTADYSPARICRAITDIYESFAELEREGQIAIVVQANVHNTARGHLSNERRVSKTVNQWMWENEPSNGEGRFNSQRSMSPPQDQRLVLKPGNQSAQTSLFQQVGRWCTSLKLGPAHLE